MDNNQKIALEETVSATVEPVSYALVGASITSATLFVAYKLGATEVEAVLSSIIVLFGSFGVFAMYDNYKYRLEQLRREQSRLELRGE